MPDDMRRPTASIRSLRRFRGLSILVSLATLVALVPLAAMAAPKQPSVSVGDVVVSEGSGTASFMIKAKPRPRGYSLSVDWATADGSAVGPDDYVSASGTATLTPSGSTARVNIPITADALDEPDESFLVNLSNLVGTPGTISDAQAVGTITDDDSAPTISIDDVVLGEGEAGTSAATFTLGLSGPSGRTVTVQWATSDGTATQPSDYVAASGAATFVPGDTSEAVAITVKGDTTLEVDETFTVGLSNPTNATVSDGTGTGTVVADEVEPVVSISNASVAEGDSGSATLSFTASLSRAGLVDATVDWATSNGSALAPGDYTAASGTLTFVAGDVAETVNVTANGDAAFELDETLSVTLSNLSNAFLGDGLGVGTISNDDPLPTVAIPDVSVTEGNAGNKSATFDITLSTASGSTASVGWTTVDGTALGGTDYVVGSGVLSFAAGDVSETVTVDVNADTLDEPNEWFSVVLSAPSGAAITDNSGRGTVVDDDKTPTALTLAVRKRPLRVIGSGRLEPAKIGFRVTVSLARRRANGTFVNLRSKTITVTGVRDRDGDGLKEGVYRASFLRPSRRGTYRMTSKFLGTPTHARSMKRVAFTIR